MSQIDEVGRGATQLRGALRDGLEALDLNQQVTFAVYTRIVLPLDGYIFWQPQPGPLTFPGSLHFTQEIQQTEDEIYGAATCTFTSEQKIAQFERVPIDTIYIATVAGFRFAFSQQDGFYEQAGLWHYFGRSLAPAMQGQLLDTPGVVNLNEAVAANSLPLWIALNSYVCPYYDGFQLPALTLYPAKLSPPNLLPAYGIIDIPDDGTRALQSVPWIDKERNHWQLAADRVRIITYGLQSNEIYDFLDFVEQYSVQTGNFGIMNTPIVRDGTRSQSEIVSRAMQKFIDFEISYYQTRSAQVARQLILSATVDIFPVDIVNRP